MDSQTFTQILSANKGNIPLKDDFEKKYYEAKLLLLVVFGFGLIDAIMRRGIAHV
jgi:hypothetical protein